MTRELTPATKLAIQRQKDGPWCVVCGNSMPQAVVDMGYQTHPKCDPHEVADPLLSVRFSSRESASNRSTIGHIGRPADRVNESAGLNRTPTDTEGDDL